MLSLAEKEDLNVENPLQSEGILTLMNMEANDELSPEFIRQR